jgi:hemoglobin/transferrin/lactoferrin receptor protein
MGSRSARPLLLACTALVAVSAILPAYAQDATTSTTAASSDETQLQTIVVKGKRVPAGSVADTPLATQTTAEELRKKEVNSVSDLKQIDTGVQYSSTDKGFVIRGMEGNRVTTLVDGIPIPYLSNSARAGGPSTSTNANGGATTFSFNALSSVDIVKGADSSRAGSGALGGAVVLRTLEPEDLIREGRNWGAIAKSTYDSSNRSLGGSLAVAGRSGNTSVLLQGSYTKGHETESTGDTAGIGFNRDEANPADFKEQNLLFKLRQQLEGGHRIGVTAEHYNRDLDTDLQTIAGGTTSSRGYDGLVGFEDSRRDRVSLDYDFANGDAFFDTVQSTLYWQKVQREAGNEGTRLANPTGYWYRNNAIEEESVGISGKLGRDFDTGDLTHKLTIAGSYSYFWTQGFTDGMDGCIAGTYVGSACNSLHADQSDMPDVTGNRLSVRVDDEIRLRDSAFFVNPGLSFDWFDYNPQETEGYENNAGYAGLPDARSGNRFSPKLLVGYDVSPDLQLFGQVSMAYRAPTVDELYLLYTGQGGPTTYAVAGNPDLKEETGTGFELGANYDSGASKLRVVGFYNDYRNFIDSRDIGPVGSYSSYTEYYNRSHVRIAGVEVGGSHEFANGFHVSGSLTYTSAKDVDEDEYVRTVVPFRAITGIGYSAENWGADLTGIFASAMKETSTANIFNASGYGIANLTAWWEPKQVEGLRIQAGIYNIFDKQYWDGVAYRDLSTSTPSNSNTNQPLAFYSEPGRHFKISITKTF